VSPRAHPYYPAFLDLEGRLAVVVGSGSLAERRVRTLLRHGADIAVVAPEPGEALRGLEAEGRITLEVRGYVRGDLEDAFLAVCASGSQEVDRAVRDEAEERRCLVNVAGAPDLSSFVIPSVVRRGDLQIAVSTGGGAPALAKRVRRRLDEEYGPAWAAYVALAGEVRSLAFTRLGEDRAAAILEAVADSDLLDRIEAGGEPSAEEVLAEFEGEGVENA